MNSVVIHYTQTDPDSSLQVYPSTPLEEWVSNILYSSDNTYLSFE